ncbi:MAG: T9SS type A sorting domain-containing protein [Flavobacteriia bacterium]|nr:T9SS type A sorting domain-containing protein [Flavobacteriia bacterium]
MKRLLLLSALLLTGALSAQHAMNIYVMDNSGNSLAGVALFTYHDYGMSFNQVPVERFDSVYYSSNNGVTAYWEYNRNPGSMDTVRYAAFDCNGVMHRGEAFLQTGQGWNDTLFLPCAPTACQAIVRGDAGPNNLWAEGVNLRTLAAAGNPFANNHSFFINNTRFQPSWTNSERAYLYLTPSMGGGLSGNVAISYTRSDSNCAVVTDSVNLPWPGGSNLQCNAYFYPDSVNTGAFQGQYVLIEASSSSSGNVVDWFWDMGDGNAYNTQYPIHTYSATSAASYQVCLTILAIDGNDTCSDTYCQTIRFDSTGAPILKQGWTVNVVDPATFSVDEDELIEVLMYPNPSNGDVRITWEESLEVKSVDVFQVNGQQLDSFTPQSNETELTNLSAGVYIVRIETPTAVLSQKLIVQ